MTHTVEDTLEILSGQVARKVNIRIDSKDKNIIVSLGRQVQKGLALTDRQLELALSKIAKYRVGLETNMINVSDIIANPVLRFPLRTIDREQRIYFYTAQETNQQRIGVKFTFSKNLDNIWQTLTDKLTGGVEYDSSVKSVVATELNLYYIVHAFKDHNFEVDSEIREIYEKLEEILKNRQSVLPLVLVENGNYSFKNLSQACSAAINESCLTITDENVVESIVTLKKYGIFEKSQEIVEKIQNSNASDVSKKIALSPATRFRLLPEKFSFDDTVSIIKNLSQLPVLVILDENNKIFDQTIDLINAFRSHVADSEMTVFFRLDNGQTNHNEFNQFVKDNHLNNYIDQKTKVVFITKTRIPKPLLKADWHPQSALALTNYDFGKIATYLNDLPTVYYYNDSITVRHNRIKGSLSVDEL